MTKKTLYYILLCVIPALLGIVLSVVSFFNHDIIAANVTLVGLGGGSLLFCCFIVATYIHGKHLLDDGADGLVVVLSKFLGIHEYNFLFAFFAHVGIVILSFGTPGTIVYWVLTFWPWR